MKPTKLVQDLVSSLQIMPGIGARSARRIAYFLINKNPGGAIKLSESISAAIARVNKCSYCNMLIEDSDLCDICMSRDRDKELICIVKGHDDLMSIERSNSYNGLYYILLSEISPIDGVGAINIGLPRLIERIRTEKFKEALIALNFTQDGRLTANCVYKELSKFDGLKISRISGGVPIGGEIEFLSLGTLSHSINNRVYLVKNTN